MNIDKEIKLPFYAEATIFLIGSIALFAILYIAKDIIAPLVFAIIIAILLHPLVNFFVTKKINRIIAIVFSIFLTFLFIAALCALIYSQVISLSESWPILVNKFTLVVNESITWASGFFNIDPENIHEWITKTKGEIININSALIGKTLITLGSGLVLLFLIPIYLFLLLFYQPLLLDFIHRLFSTNNHSRVNEIIIQIKNVIQHYLIGLIIEFVLVSLLNAVALIILGIDYAILIGVIGGLLNVIPYIGGLVAVAIPMMIALVTKDSSWYAFYVLAVYYFIQLIDNNFIVPKIVASKVKINALFAIVIVFVGNAIWGVPGMFLSLPLLAIIKLIFDHIEPLKPWGFLLGDTMPHILKIKPIFKRIKKKSE